MSRIVLEGPDHAGKTTLAKQLCTITGAKYHHPGGAPVDEMAERACLMEQQFLIERAGPLVLDRVTCVSQQVYNPNEALDPVRTRCLDTLCTSPFVFVVYCRPPNEHLVDVGNYTWRPEETEEHRQKIMTRAFEWVERYDRVMEKVPHLSYDFKDVAAAKTLETALIGALTEDGLWMQWLSATVLSGGRR